MKAIIKNLVSDEKTFLLDENSFNFDEEIELEQSQISLLTNLKDAANNNKFEVEIVKEKIEPKTLHKADIAVEEIGLMNSLINEFGNGNVAIAVYERINKRLDDDISGWQE